MAKLLGTALLASFAAVTFAFRPTARPEPPAPLVVHEWGTVTTKHSVTGLPEGCLNRVNVFEPLPAFVHSFDPSTQGFGTRRIPIVKSDAFPCREDITMRLETPVMYFHPRAGDSIPPFDVHVDFRGGVLNEFYPLATATANGWNGVRLHDGVQSSLDWRAVTLHDSVTPPFTRAHVWLSPRAVQSRPLTVGTESEQYIFYRGMAHLDAVVRTGFTGSDLRVRPPLAAKWFSAPSVTLGRMWLVDVAANGKTAFRETDSLTLRHGDSSATLASFRGFTAADYSPQALDRLRASMHRALVGRGLNPDEADAMLETWKNSYFAEPGLRLFYIAPREWVDYYLPLRFSIPTTVTRVIVGRIDLPAGWP